MMKLKGIHSNFKHNFRLACVQSYTDVYAILYLQAESPFRFVSVTCLRQPLHTDGEGPNNNPWKSNAVFIRWYTYRTKQSSEHFLTATLTRVKLSLRQSSTKIWKAIASYWLRQQQCSAFVCFANLLVDYISAFFKYTIISVYMCFRKSCQVPGTFKPAYNIIYAYRLH